MARSSSGTVNGDRRIDCVVMSCTESTGRPYRGCCHAVPDAFFLRSHMATSPRDPTSSGHALYLLGGIEVRGVPAEAADRLLAQSKVVGLLAYLALSPRGRHQRRDLLVGLLWPELDQAHARGALRKAVHAVRGALGEGTLVGRGDEELMLASDHLSCDAWEFTEDAEAGRFRDALALYRGELMPGFHLSGCVEFGSWLAQERTAAAHGAAAAAWALATQLETEQRLTEAGNMARQVVQYEWSDERVLRRTMLMLQRIGDQAGAIRVLEDFAAAARRAGYGALSGDDGARGDDAAGVN
jgi:DNA-binding SARP family transcriptional activator